MPPFKKQIQQKLRGKLTEKELEILPSSYQKLGHCIILRLHKELNAKKEIIGEAVLALELPGVKTICLNSGKIDSEFREPKIEYLCGEHSTLVDHMEHGCVFRFDITKLMWSMGNMNERKRMYENVKKGEVVVDFFAGLGYWVIPICKHSKPEKVYAIDANENAIDALHVNKKLNHIPDKMLSIIHGKCEEVSAQLAKKADRVILGYLPAPTFALPAAFHVLKDAGGMLHYEGACEQGKFDGLMEDVRSVAVQYGWKIELAHAQEVKSIGPKLYHYTLDIRVTPFTG